MLGRRVWIAGTTGALVAAAALVAPAFGATEQGQRLARRAAAIESRAAGSFTPAAADPRLAAMFARGGFDASGFRFTPAETGRSRGVTVAVRARTQRGTDQGRVAAAVGPTVGITPIAYNLGASVGWKRLALSGEVTRVDFAQAPGSREQADVAVRYSGNRISGQLKAIADRPLQGMIAIPDDRDSYSLDASTSYSLTRNLDVTAGVRYRTDRERLTRAEDHRDSQAVYVGTAFRF